MAITSSEVSTAVNDNIKHTSTDRELLLALKKLSGAGNILFAIDESQSLADGDTTLDYPDDFKGLGHIVLNDGTYDGRPLIECTYEQYLEYQNDKASSSRSEPRVFAEMGQKFYVEPISDGAYTAKIHHYRYHPEDVSTILFRDEWRGAIYSLTTYYVAKRYGLTRYIALYGLTDAGALKLALGEVTVTEQPHFTKYRDMP